MLKDLNLAEELAKECDIESDIIFKRADSGVPAGQVTPI